MARSPSDRPAPPDLAPFDTVYVEAAARILGVLSHPTRLHLVLLVAQGETHVSRLAELLEVSQSNVSHHLGLLRNLGLVTDRRDGQFVRYRVNADAWELLAHGFFEHLVEGSDELRLRGFSLRREEEDPEVDPVQREPEEARAGSPGGMNPEAPGPELCTPAEDPGSGRTPEKGSKKGRKGRKKGGKRGKRRVEGGKD